MWIPIHPSVDKNVAILLTGMYICSGHEMRLINIVISSQKFRTQERQRRSIDNKSYLSKGKLTLFILDNDKHVCFPTGRA